MRINDRRTFPAVMFKRPAKTPWRRVDPPAEPVQDGRMAPLIPSGFRAVVRAAPWSRRGPVAFALLLLAFGCAALVGMTAEAAAADDGDAPALKVHVLSGSNEYRSEESLRAWMEWSCEQHAGRLELSATWLEDRAEEIPAADLDRIAAADVLLVFCRRWVLPEPQLEVLRDYWRGGGAVVAIRTASHAFDNDTNKEFDHQVLGGDYDGHGDDRAAPVTNQAEALPWGGPMPDVSDWATSKLYKQNELAEDVKVWQSATAGDVGEQVVTWSLDPNPFGGRTFSTSLGTPDDFAAPGFHEMLLAAVLWVAAGAADAATD